MKIIKISIIALFIFLFFGCSNIDSTEIEYDYLIDTIEHIEISTNQLFNLNVTFDEYRKSFINKFANDSIEEKFLKEDDFLFYIAEGSNTRKIARGELDHEMIEKLKESLNKSSSSKLTAIEFSIAYMNDVEDEKTIYIKNIYEYPQWKQRGDDKNIKADKVLKRYVFCKGNNQWKITSIDQLHLGYLYEDEENGQEEWKTLRSIMHRGEEVQYVRMIEEKNDVYINKDILFNELTLEEREEQLKNLKGKDIIFGQLLEEVFPEVLAELSDDAKEVFYRSKYDWNTEFHKEILDHIKEDPFTSIELNIND